MPQTKNNAKKKSAKKKREPKRFVSDTGQYLYDDAAGKLFKQWHEMISTAIRLPTKPSTPE
jgi:hypothetical protein